MRVWKVSITALMILSMGMLSLGTVSASGSIKDVKKKKTELELKVTEEKNKIKDYEKAKEELEDQIRKLDKKIEKLSEELESLDDQILIVRSGIRDKNKVIHDGKEKKDELYLELKNKIKFIYENSSRSDLQNMIDAQDMSDILNKQVYIKEIYSFDNEKIDRLKELIGEIKLAKEELKGIKDQLKELKKEYKKQQQDLFDVLETKQKEITDFEAKIEDAGLKKKAYLSDIEEQDRIIERIEKAAALKKKKEEEKRRQEELKRQQEEDPKKKEESLQGSVSSKGFVWPCPGYSRVSSEFGYRKHPTLKIRKMHNGIDFAAPTGTLIVAAKAGTVLEAGYNATMGNYIIIDHGGGISTIYMHCSKLKVRTGAEVTAGQGIATVGSTGRSTGPHLHFGVKVNGNYVNPRTYLK